MIPEALQAPTLASFLNGHDPFSPISSTSPIPTVVPDVPDVQKIHETGARTLWVIFVLMVLASAAFAALSWTVPVSRRVFHVLITTVTIIGSLSYFAMATGHGISFLHIRHREHHEHVPDTFQDIYRQVFWARYLDWLLTTPLILTSLGVLSGLSGAHLVMAILANITWILTGLFSSLGHHGTPQKWGWFTISVIAYLVVVWHIVLNGRPAALARGNKVARSYTLLGGYTVVVWTLYPIIWGVVAGTQLSVDAEVVIFAVLDVLSKAGYGAWLLSTVAKVPETQLEVGGFWANGLEGEGAVRLGDDGP